MEKVFEDCRIACGKCKSVCIEKGDTSLLTICDLCMLACTQMCMCLRRPTQCSPALLKHIQKHCQTVLKECMTQCRAHGHAKCAQSCEKAYHMCSRTLHHTTMN